MGKNNNFCSGCGEKLESGQSFCPNCGKKVNEVEKKEDKNVEEPKNEENFEEKKEKKVEMENNPTKKKVKVGDIIRYIIGGFLILVELPSLFQSKTFLNSALWILFGISLFPFVYRKFLYNRIKTEKGFKAIQVIIPISIYIIMVILTSVGIIEHSDDDVSTQNQGSSETTEQRIVRNVNSKLSRPNQEIEKYELNAETNKYDFKIKSTNNSYTKYSCAEDSQNLAKKLAGSESVNSIQVQCISNGNTVFYVRINNIDALTTENINDNTKYFDENSNEVNTNIDTLKANIVTDYKNSCANYNYKDVLRNPDEYQGKNAYWFGEIVQVVSKSKNYSVFRIDVTCEKYEYIEGYMCSDTVYVTYYGTDSFIEDDMVKMWGVMNGTETYTTILGASVTIPKFTAKYMELQ